MKRFVEEVTDMVIQLKNSLLAAALVTLAPVAPSMFGTATDASAHTSVSGSISFGGPVVHAPQVAVIGFSYGNPYLYGPVYDSPEYCNVGQVFYYPRYRVWAPRYSGYRYYNYAQPRYYRRAPAHHIRGHAYGHGNGHYSGNYSHRGRDGDGGHDGRRNYGRRHEVRGHDRHGD